MQSGNEVWYRPGLLMRVTRAQYNLRDTCSEIRHAEDDRPAVLFNRRIRGLVGRVVYLTFLDSLDIKVPARIHLYSLSLSTKNKIQDIASADYRKQGNTSRPLHRRTKQ